MRRKARGAVAGLLAAVFLSLGGNAMAGNFALVIGISQYKDPAVPDLRYADSDAREIASFLRSWSRFTPDCIKLLVNAEATGANIRTAFKDLETRCAAKGTGPGLALIHFSGHAVTAGDTAGSSFLKTGRGGQSREFLVPHDAQPSDTYTLPDGSETNETFLKKEWFASRLGGLSEHYVSVVIDACHSGMPDFSGLMRLYVSAARTSPSLTAAADPQSKGLGRVDAAVGPDSSGRRVALLAASNEEKVAYEFPELKHGALSYAILQALYAARNKVPKGQPFVVDMESLFGEVKTIFEKKKVRGKALADYHRPEVYFYPETASNPVQFASLTGALVPPPSPQLLAAPKPANTQTVAATLPAAKPNPSAATAAAGIPATAPTALSPAAPDAPKFGNLQLAGAIPEGATVEVDGELRAWRRGETLRLPAGPHILAVVAPAFSYRQVSSVTVTEGRVSTLSLSFVGTLSVESRDKANPAAAGPELAVYLDDKLIGEGSQLTQANISAGTHKLTVKVLGTENTKEVSIRPDSPLLVRYLVTMVTNPQRERRGVPDVPL
ncbi:MAG: caspase family protein [Xanthobacteraceae bacterium]